MSYGESKIGTLWRGYYITAYGIAVKHGFKGTDEEWLESLVGKAVEIRYNDVTNVLEWSYAGEDVWTELLSLEDLQTEIVAQTLAQAEAAKQAAQNAQTAAEAAQSAAEAAQQEAEQNAGITQADASITQTNVQLTQEAKTAAEAAQQAAQNAQQAAEAAGTNAEESATLSKSWAVGGTGTRPGEDTNNAEYWAKQAAIAAGGGVLTFNGRTGNVTPEQGDYTPDQVGAADKTLSNLTDYQKALFNIGGRPGKNLVKNWFFAGGGSQLGFDCFPINQRGKTEYVQDFGNAYGPDNWVLEGGSSIALKSTHMEFQTTNNAITQPETKEFLDKLVGKQVTVSCLTLENELASATGVVNDFSQATGIQAVFSGGSVAFTVFPNVAIQVARWDGSGNIVACKVEEGPIQTLAYKDSNGIWQLFETQDYGEELARCQKNLLRVSINSAWGYAESAERAYLFISLPVTMRATPVWKGTLPKLYPNDGNEVTSASVLSKSDNTIVMIIDGTGFTPGKTYSANEIEGFLSAEP